MKTILIFVFFIIISGSFFSLNLANAEIEGAYVSKIFRDNTRPGLVSVSILICAGNDDLNFPEIMVTSEKDAKFITISGVVPKNICRGDTVFLEADNLSSITATLVNPKEAILIDEVDRISEKVYFQGMSVDGNTQVKVSSSIPVSGESSIIEVEFLDHFLNPVKNMHYDISVTQNDKVVLEKKDVVSLNGIRYHETKILQTDSPLDIQIRLHEAESKIVRTIWNGSEGELIQFKTVPEFGTIAALILIVALTSIIAISAKSSLSIIPRL